jgi:hypothetical protein
MIKKKKRGARKRSCDEKLEIQTHKHAKENTKEKENNLDERADCFVCSLLLLFFFFSVVPFVFEALLFGVCL